MILALGLVALVIAALVGVGLVYDGLARDRRRIDGATASLAALEARRAAAEDEAERAGVEAHVAYAREHLDDLLARHDLRLRTGPTGLVARSLKLTEQGA